MNAENVNYWTGEKATVTVTVTAVEADASFTNATAFGRAALDQIAMFFSPDVTKETARRAARYAVAHLTRWSREISLDAETNRITV